jgi:hypothetical protein
LLGLAPPEPGSVIRYAYLWADENSHGREEGEKDRPALVLAVSPKPDEGTSEVLVLAITHTPSSASEDAVPIPRDVKQRIGLDDAPSWIVTTEANASIWPGDIRPSPAANPRKVWAKAGPSPARPPDNAILDALAPPGVTACQCPPPPSAWRAILDHRAAKLATTGA